MNFMITLMSMFYVFLVKNFKILKQFKIFVGKIFKISGELEKIQSIP